MSGNLLFIDSRVADKDSLTASFSPDTNWYVLDADRDGLDQMFDILDGRCDFDSIQIISHGSPGSITIGSTVLDNGTLTAYADQLAAIGRSLTESGDLLLYGCNVGAGAEGEEFVAALAELTGADVAASDDVTGGSEAGGDWELEVSTGAISSVAPLSSAATQEYGHTLGVVDDYMFAQMALLAYYDDPQHPNETISYKYEIAKNTWNALVEEGWQVLEGSPLANDGFSVTSFQRNNTIVIAYRGTDNPADIFADLAVGISSGGVIEVLEKVLWNMQFSYALAYANFIRNTYPDAEILLTGHSLGGALAQVVSQMFGYSGVTFESGAAKNLTSHINPNFSAVSLIYGIEWGGVGVPDTFTNYVIEGSGVSHLSGYHLGNVVTLTKSEVPFWNQFGDHGLHYMGDIVALMRSRTNTEGLNYYGKSDADTIIGNTSANEIYGYAGNDDIIGGFGDDTIIAGNGIDIINPGAGDDLIDGGDGTDIVLFSKIFAEYTISLNMSDWVTTVSEKEQYWGSDGVDRMKNVEYMHFTDAGLKVDDAFGEMIGSAKGDYLPGNDLDNRLDGRDGNDVLEGGRGYDTIIGGTGQDTVVFSGNFEDYVIGYDDVESSFTVTHTTGTDGTDYVTGVEKFQFADGMKTIQDINAASGVSISIYDYTAVHPVNSSMQMFSWHSMGEWANNSAFAATRSDGSVVTWGDHVFGGDSSSVAGKLNGDIDVVQVFSNTGAFAALRSDGSVVTWGANAYGSDSSGVANKLDGSIDVVQIFSTADAFAALREDGSAVTWGSYTTGGNSSSVANRLDGTIDVAQIFSTRRAFAALREDGSVVTWGDSSYGGNSSSVANKLDGSVGVVQVFSTEQAFAALREDGSVITWGSSYGGNSSSVADKLDGSVDVVQVFSTTWAFAALREDGSVVTWGDSSYGGNSSSVADKLDGSVDVVQVFSTKWAFAALRENGSVVTWGDGSYGGNSSSVANKLDGSVGVVQVFSTEKAFAALREDGSVVTWGFSGNGGDSSSVANKLDGVVDVVKVFYTEYAFAALREDGSVVTWGNGSYGGNSSSVANKLDGAVDVVQVFSTDMAFTALRLDGTVVTWGNSSYGGDSSGVASQLHDVVDISNIYSNSTGDQERIGTQDNDQMYGNIGNDILWGYDGNDVLAGWSGDDLVFGGAGNDLLICGEGAGNDTYDGGAGEDTVKYASALASITVDLSEGIAFSRDGNDAAGIGIDTLINIENIIAGNFNDLLIGNDGANNIEAGSGNDTLIGGDGADSLDGGNGSDTADYSEKSIQVIAILNGSTDAIVSVGGVAEDTIRNIENVIGGDGNDSLTGDAADNLFRGGDGKDSIDGGAGSDTADYYDKLESVTITLSGDSDTIVRIGGVAEDTIRNIENLIGGSGNDRLVGDNIANRLYGSAGNDTLDGGKGNDTIIGSFDEDTVIYTGNFSDYLFSYDPVNGIYTVTDSITGRDGVDMVEGVEHFRFADVEKPVADLIDIAAPWLQSRNPIGYELDVAVSTNIVLTFSETVIAGTGTVTLHGEGLDPVVIDINDHSQVTIDGATVTINPLADLSHDTQYTLSIDGTAITDMVGKRFAGLNDYEFRTIPDGPVCEGSVHYWQNGVAVPDVSIIVTDDQSETSEAWSGSDGGYRYNYLPAGDYTLEAVKEVGESDTEAVTADDALATFGLVFGDDDVSSFEYLTADVNRDGTVGFRDALGILKMALGRESAPAAEWVIVPATTGSEPMSSDNVIWPDDTIPVTLDQDKEIDLVGVLLGDVDGSWSER